MWNSCEQNGRSVTEQRGVKLGLGEATPAGYQVEAQGRKQTQYHKQVQLNGKQKKLEQRMVIDEQLTVATLPITNPQHLV